MGPSKGMPDSIRAADAPLMARTSGVLQVGTEDGPDHVDLVSESFGERRPQRPVDQPVGQDGLVRRLPFPAEKEPGILPIAYMRSSMSTVRGKKSVPSRTPFDAVAVTRIMVSPMRPRNSSVGLAGELARLE